MYNVLEDYLKRINFIVNNNVLSYTQEIFYHTYKYKYK